MTCDKICIMSDKILQPNDNTEQVDLCSVAELKLKELKKLWKKNMVITYNSLVTGSLNSCFL